MATVRSESESRIAQLESKVIQLEQENAELRRAGDSGGQMLGRFGRARFFETILDHLYDGVCVLDADGTIRYESPAIVHITGFTAEDVVGDRFHQYVHPDDLERVQRLFAELVNAPGEWRTDEARFRTVDRGWITLEMRGVNLLGVPAIDGIVAIYRDVTEQRRAQRELEEARNRLRELSAEVPGILYQFRSAPDGSRLAIPFVSDGVRRLFGVEPESIRENPLALVNLIHPDDRGRYVELAGDSAARGIPFRLDVRCIDVEGETRWLRVSAVPRLLDDGDRLFNGIAIDVTSEVRATVQLQGLTVSQGEKVRRRNAELEKALAALEHAADQREVAETEIRRLKASLDEAVLLSTTAEMMAGVAHDLHQPLTAIANYSAGCLIRIDRGALTERETERVLNEVKESAMRAAEVVRRAREFTRSRTFDRRPLNPNDVCDTARKLAAVALRDRSVTLLVEYADDLPPALADRIPIAQVVLNLLDNAAEAMQSKPPVERRVVLRTALVDGCVRVSVLDNGSGLPADRRESIFDRFVTSKEDGLGLGLATCRSILEHHDGRIWVEPSPTGGCAFHFTLPVAAE